MSPKQVVETLLSESKFEPEFTKKGIEFFFFVFCHLFFPPSLGLIIFPTIYIMIKILVDNSIDYIHFAKFHYKFHYFAMQQSHLFGFFF